MSRDLNTFFGALSDPTRRAVVEQLAKGRATVSTLAQPHPIALPTFMRHLRVLEDSGLVRTTKKGRSRICQLDMAALAEAQGWLAWQRAVWEGRGERLAQLAETLNKDETDDR